MRGGMSGARRQSMSYAFVAAVCLCAAPAAYALDGVLSVGGTYRYGHVHWASTGKTVQFTVEAAFKRAMTDLSTWSGTAPDNLPQVGDEVVFPGRQPPQFYFGDGSVEQTLTMKVIAFSEAEDWVMGSFTIEHEYPTPNNKGEPWYAQFTGCCRHSYLVNNKDAEWVITASVDLNVANKSPRANVLPVVTVPYTPVDGAPSTYVPADDNANNTIEYRVGKPWNVGNAAVFNSLLKSFISVPLRALAPWECTTSIVGGSNFAGPGCLFKSLRTDGGQQAMTVEGWVLSARDEGGYVLSVGANDAHTLDGYDGPAPDARCASGGGNPSICNVASLMIKVNVTHITVGHETYGNGVAGKQQEAFEVCSNTYLQDDYLCTPTQTTTNKWFHLAVVRFQHGVSGSSQTSSSAPQVTYKVLINGRPLMVSTYPGGPARQRIGQEACGPSLPTKCPACLGGCATGSWCSGGVCSTCPSDASCTSGDQFRFGCKGTSSGSCKLKAMRVCTGTGGYCSQTMNLFENGESNLVPGPAPNSTTDGTAVIVRDFAKGAALIFGAYKGALAQPYQYFDGALDEWRFWNGARSDSSILNNFKRIMTVDRETFYGDPSDPAMRITEENYLVKAVLMASWSFDQECPLAGSTGCKLETINSIYPKDQDARVPYPPGKSMYEAFSYNMKTGNTDYQGRMFYSLSDGMEIDSKGKLTIHTRLIGEHQAVVLMSYPGNVAPVPVDFIIKVVPAHCVADRDDDAKNDCELCGNAVMLRLPDYTCEYDNTPGVRNEWMPFLSIKASVFNAYSADVLAGNAYYVGGAQVLDINANLYPYSIRVYAGFEVKLQLHGLDKQEVVNEVVDLEGVDYDHIFTKVGFTLGRMPESAKFTAVHDTNPSQLDMSWTPCSHEVGAHTLCFEAVDSHQAPGDKPGRSFAPRSSSMQKCVQIDVQQEAAPHFILGADATPDTRVTCTMGRKTELKVLVGSGNCQASITVAAQSGSVLPAGASLSLVSSGLVHGEVEKEKVCREAEFAFNWTPSQGQGGFDQKVCLEAKSLHTGVCAGTAPTPSIHCVHIYVERCKYALQEDQQLQEIAELYSIDWMRLWSLNGALMHPDYVIYGGPSAAPLMVGHLYSALSNEVPLEIAKRMGMSQNLMQKLNYGLDLFSPLSHGDQLCVVPNSCTGAAKAQYSALELSSLASYLGQTAADVHPIKATDWNTADMP